MKGNVFNKTGALRPGKSKFNLSHTVTFDCTFGKLYPIEAIDCVPDSVYYYNSDGVVGRLLSALKSPMLADVDIVLESFFVPYRLLMGSDANFDTETSEGNFDEILSGGKSGTKVVLAPKIVTKETFNGADQAVLPNGIADYVGFPVGHFLPTGNPDNQNKVNAFVWRAYRLIWNSFYRDEMLMDEIQVPQWTVLNQDYIPFSEYDKLLSRCWRKDYFTSALPSQQHGVAPALPISGIIPVTGLGDISNGKITNLGVDLSVAPSQTPPFVRADAAGFYTDPDATEPLKDVKINVNSSGVSGKVLPGTFNVDLKDGVTFNVSDLRTATQIQKQLERMERGGYRYTEILRAHFGVAPSDARLQRPEFLGSIRQPWIVSGVTQTSSPTKDSTGTFDSYTGELSGQMVTAGHGKIFKYHTYEYGIILVLASVVPRAQYQQGCLKDFQRRSMYEFFWPEFVHLSEQPVYQTEIFASDKSAVNETVFGFQPIYTEYRWKPSRVCGHLREGATPSFDYWTIQRTFETAPKLNADFLLIDGDPSPSNPLFAPFAVQDENPFIVSVSFKARGILPLPAIGEPGYMDHF